MNNLKKYGMLISIIATLIVGVQGICLLFGLNIDISFLLDMGSILIAIFVVFGLVKSESPDDPKTFDDLKNEIKSDLKAEVEKKQNEISANINSSQGNNGQDNNAQANSSQNNNTQNNSSQNNNNQNNNSQ